VTLFEPDACPNCGDTPTTRIAVITNTGAAEIRACDTCQALLTAQRWDGLAARHLAATQGGSEPRRLHLVRHMVRPHGMLLRDATGIGAETLRARHRADHDKPGGAGHPADDFTPG
jgi:hypothetical protein